jgi:tRNA threonylcarbamoyladenosine biosynthesis protein TsaB
MAILLNIDTAVETASVCLSDNAEVIHLAVNENQKDHAAWLHTAIHDALKSTGLAITEVNAVSISIGPGSYTGLRIGLAAAKGLCYALKIPLIGINTLKMMANAANNTGIELICPLIDARRMEVFAAVYNKSLEEIVKPFAMILVEESFTDVLSSHQVIFCGNGSKKLQTVLSHPHAIFSDTVATAADLPLLAYQYFQEKSFADPAYIEPLYIKEFHSAVHNF